MSTNPSRRKIAFVSTLNCAPWGGSEVLWSATAQKLLAFGHAVTASVCHWPERAKPVARLVELGMSLNERRDTLEWLRPRPLQNLAATFVRRVSRRSFAKWLHAEQPDLVCISQGSTVDDLSALPVITASGCRYVTVVHANSESIWPDDNRARMLIDLYQNAERAFFVSEGNRHLLETQLGVEFKNAAVVRNPFNVRREAAPAWPADSEPVRFACIGRIEPGAKGQDLLLHVLASEPWRSRPVSVSFYGEGDKVEGLQRLTRRLGLEQRVRFCGHVADIEKVWAEHHALVLPSRFEGLPITIVEAMHCGRPVIVTDVAGNAEVVQEGVTGFIAEAPTARHVGAALERAWQQRDRWQTIGQAAARSIREFIPADPAAVFAQTLIDLAGAEH
jgi:glycosyltransferase involved in cell wall biosynthesis